MEKRTALNLTSFILILSCTLFMLFYGFSKSTSMQDHAHSNVYQFPKSWPKPERPLGWVQGDMSTKEPPLILYARVPKCGGRSLIGVMQKLSMRNNFFIDEDYIYYGPTPMSMRNLTDAVHAVAKMQPPRITHPHLPFINFERFGYRNPVYISIVRDPVEKAVSHYYFSIYGDHTPVHDLWPENAVPNISHCILSGNPNCDWTGQLLMTKYFCGPDALCVNGSKESVRRAKQHIDEDYIFVGLTEEFDNNLKILEHVLPNYFEGAVEVWDEIKAAFMQATATRYKDELIPEARRELERMLVHDYEVYNYIRETFARMKESFGIQ